MTIMLLMGILSSCKIILWPSFIHNGNANMWIPGSSVKWRHIIVQMGHIVGGNFSIHIKACSSPAISL